MKVVVSDVNSWKKKLDIIVPAQEVETKKEEKINHYQKTARLDGFRKGKVPRSLIKKRFGASIEAEAIDECIDKFFKKAVVENNIDIVSAAKIVKIDFNDVKDLEFTAEVEVNPDVEVKDYLNIKVEKDVFTVTDEEVENTLTRLQEEAATIEETDDPAEEGSIIKGTVQETDENGVPIVGKRWEGQVFELGKEPITGETLKQLEGIKKGEERKFSLNIPQKDNTEEPNKNVVFIFTLETTYKKKLPELDAEFAKRFGPFETIDDLKKHIRESFVKENEKQSDTILENRIIDEIIKKNDFELPPSLVETALDSLWEDYSKDQKNTINEKEFRDYQRPNAEWNLKWYILRDEIIKLEGIEVTDQDIEDYLKKVEEISEEEAKKIRRHLKNKSNREKFKRDLLSGKVMDFLKEKSKIKEVKKKAKS